MTTPKAGAGLQALPHTEGQGNAFCCGVHKTIPTESLVARKGRPKGQDPQSYLHFWSRSKHAWLQGIKTQAVGGHGKVVSSGALDK